MLAIGLELSSTYQFRKEIPPQVGFDFLGHDEKVTTYLSRYQAKKT